VLNMVLIISINEVAVSGKMMDATSKIQVIRQIASSCHENILPNSFCVLHVYTSCDLKDA